MSKNPILKYFKYDHLPPHLQAVSKPIAEMAERVLRELPDCDERNVGLRKLLEAKDCFVRAAIVEPVDGDGKSIVYSRPECIFTYCPHPEMCKSHGCNALREAPQEERIPTPIIRD